MDPAGSTATMLVKRWRGFQDRPVRAVRSSAAGSSAPPRPECRAQQRSPRLAQRWRDLRAWRHRTLLGQSSATDTVNFTHTDPSSRTGVRMTVAPVAIEAAWATPDGAWRASGMAGPVVPYSAQLRPDRLARHRRRRAHLGRGGIDMADLVEVTDDPPPRQATGSLDAWTPVQASQKGIGACSGAGRADLDRENPPALTVRTRRRSPSLGWNAGVERGGLTASPPPSLGVRRSSDPRPAVCAGTAWSADRIERHVRRPGHSRTVPAGGLLNRPRGQAWAASMKKSVA